MDYLAWSVYDKHHISTPVSMYVRYEWYISGRKYVENAADDNHIAAPKKNNDLHSMSSRLLLNLSHYIGTYNFFAKHHKLINS